MKLKTLLTLAFFSLCSWQGAWADRSAPQLPEAVALVDGQSYYLYNVLENKFLCRSTTSNSSAAIGTYGVKVTIVSTEEDNGYQIKIADTNTFLMAYDTYVDWYYVGSYRDFLYILESSQGYTIQRSSKNSYYVADEYIGYNGHNGDRLNPALAEGSIHWQLMSVDDAEHYFAKHKLYTALAEAETYNFYITQYEDIYNNPSSTTAELNQAYETLNDAMAVSTNYRSPEWTEYPVLLQNLSDGKWYADNDRITWSPLGDGNVKTSSLKGTVVVDGDATLVYAYRKNDDNCSLRVYLDGELINTISKPLSGNNWRKYYIEMTAGKHDIVWEAVCCPRDGYWEYNYLSEIGVVNTPTLYPATTTVEGQLGTEMLKLIDPVSKTKKVVITGVIGADDWTTIGLMKDAFSIDMSGATAEEIPDGMFTLSNFYFLHSFKLPQGLKRIGNRAFYESDIDEAITFPSSLEFLGSEAYQYSKITAAYLGNSKSLVDREAFSDCYFLENASWSPSETIIPDLCFDLCYNLRTFEIPEGVTEIKEKAFRSCLLFNPRFPSTIKRIYYDAFWNTATDRLEIAEDVTVNYHAFGHCNNLVYVEWPTSFDYAKAVNLSYGTTQVVVECPKLKDVYLKSPTKVLYDGDVFFEGNTLSDITLHVPDYLVITYKLDPYWSQCNVVGFNSADVSNWTVKQNLTLNDGQRIGGTPNLYVYEKIQVTVNGDTEQTLGDFTTTYDFSNRYPNPTMVLSNTDNVNITGNHYIRYWTYEKQWHFVTLPFDMKVSDITTENGASYAIRYYDGASRAELGVGSNWKNYSPDDIIPAGTGFIYQTSKEGWTMFKSQDNASKQYVFANNIFTKSLNQYPSDITANKGWNLVGNPWQTYYNIHKLNFTAPITVWKMNSWGGGNYEAYSIIDDDYAIKPLEAIFVQCPDELNSISFPIDGRQLTDVIESQNAVKQYGPVVNERKLIDVELSNGELTDKTRFVLNPKAEISYELNRDASKFFSMDVTVPQIYTIENGELLAINERPIGKGTVQVGFKVAQNGTYTISSPRCQFESIVLVDTETGIDTELANGGSYTFNASAGSNNSRFVLRMGGATVTNINDLQQDNTAESTYYNLNGQRIVQPQKGLYIVNGKKVLK